MTDVRPKVDLIALHLGGAAGIARYGQEIVARLGDRADLQVTGFNEPPLAGRFTPLKVLPAAVQQRRPGSIVHFTQIMGQVLMAYRPVRPALGSVHDLGRLACPEDDEMLGPVGRLLFQVQLMGLRRMDHWVVNSEFTRRCMMDLLGLPGERITVNQLGVDSDNFRPIAGAAEVRTSRFGIPPAPDGALDMVYAGNEQPRKGLVYLLEAMAVLKARGERVRLVKVGDAGGQVFRERFLRTAERLGVRDNIVLAGRVSDANLPVFYSAADIYVCPTLLEGGFNWPVMEAMASGTPAVATTAALVQPPARDAAIEVPPRAAADLADAIAVCLHDRERLARMTAAARPAVLPFTWAAAMDRLLNVYRMLADRRAQAGAGAR